MLNLWNTVGALYLVYPRTKYINQPVWYASLTLSSKSPSSSTSTLSLKSCASPSQDRSEIHDRAHQPLHTGNTSVKSFLPLSLSLTLCLSTQNSTPPPHPLLEKACRVYRVLGCWIVWFGLDGKAWYAVSRTYEPCNFINPPLTAGDRLLWTIGEGSWRRMNERTRNGRGLNRRIITQRSFDLLFRGSNSRAMLWYGEYWRDWLIRLSVLLIVLAQPTYQLWTKSNFDSLCHEFCKKEEKKITNFEK